LLPAGRVLAHDPEKWRPGQKFLCKACDLSKGRRGPMPVSPAIPFRRPLSREGPTGVSVVAGSSRLRAKTTLRPSGTVQTELVPDSNREALISVTVDRGRPLEIRNRLLASLASEDLMLMARHLHEVRIEQGEMLEEPGRSVDAVYFPGSSWNRVGDFGVENARRPGIARGFCILMLRYLA
jgi:hypothetical protein